MERQPSGVDSWPPEAGARPPVTSAVRGCTSGLTTGAHALWAYDSDQEHRAGLVSYLTEGLAHGERIAYVGHDGSEAHVYDYLQGEGCDVGDLVATGRLILGAGRDRARRSDFDLDARLRDYAMLAENARTDGFSAFRVADEISGLFKGPGLCEHWLAYELRADLLAAHVPFTALCCGDTRLIDAGSLRRGAAVHSSSFGAGVGHPLHGAGVEYPLYRLHSTADSGLAIEGEIDVSCSSEVAALMIGAVGHMHTPTVDVSALRFADVFGMRALYSVLRTIGEEQGEAPQVRGASPMFRKLWRLMQFDALFTVLFT